MSARARRPRSLAARAAGLTARPAPYGQVNPLQAAVHDGPGPAVVLLHGQPGTGLDWQWVVPLLTADFTVVVPDRPGYGCTGGPATGFAGNAAAVLELLDRLGLGRAVLVGHSWAGGVALQAAVDHPGRVAGLVLVSSVGPGGAVNWEDRLLAAPVLGELLAGTAIGGMGLLLGSPPVQNLARRHLGGRARDGIVALGRLTRGPSRVWRSFVAEQRALLDELEPLAGRIGSITAPTAIVHGGSDHVVPAGVSDRLHRDIAGSSRHVLAGAGHLLPHDRPADVAAAVREVAGRADRAPRPPLSG